MSESFLRQSTQIRSSDTYDDNQAAGAALESNALEIEADLNALRSQVKRVAGSTNWYDAPVASVALLSSRQITAGAGLTGGGDLSADRTLDVVANADGSIVVNANDIQVGVLASDTQHGARGGGTQHAVATVSVAGFMSAADKTKLDGIEAGAEFNDVRSVHARTGDVVAVAGDYDADQVDYNPATSGLTAVDVQAAIDELAAGGGATGDVVGPAASVDNAVVRFDGATGKLIQGSGISVSDSSQMTGVKTLTHTEPYEQSTSGATLTIDWTQGSLQRLYLNEDVSLSFTAPPGTSFKGALLTLRIVQSAGGGHVITWPASCKGTPPTINTLTGEANSTIVQFLFDGSDGFPSFFFTSKGAVVDKWAGPYGLSYQMREESELLFAWRAEPDQVSADTRGGLHFGADGATTAGQGVGLIADASPRGHDAEGVDTYAGPNKPVWENDGAARLSGNPFGAVQTTAVSSPAEARVYRWANSTDEYDFTQIHRDGDFTLLWRGVWRDYIGSIGAPGNANILQNQSPGILWTVNAGNLSFAVYDSTPSLVCSVSTAVTWNEDDIVSLAVTCSPGGNLLKLWVGTGGTGNLTVASTSTFVTGGVASPGANMLLGLTAAGVNLSTIGLVMAGKDLALELDAWELWIEGQDFSDASGVPISFAGLPWQIADDPLPTAANVQDFDSPFELAPTTFVNSSADNIPTAQIYATPYAPGPGEFPHMRLDGAREWDFNNLTETEGQTVTGSLADTQAGDLLLPTGNLIMRATAGNGGGKAVEWDGAGGAWFETAAGFQELRQPCTIFIEASFDATGVPSDGYLCDGASDGSNRFVLYTGGGGDTIKAWSGGSVAGTTIPEGVGYRMFGGAFSTDSDQGGVYVNGVKEGVGSTGAYNCLYGLRIGDRYAPNANTPMKGLIAWVGVWPVTLTPEEIQFIMTYRGY